MPIVAQSVYQRKGSRFTFVKLDFKPSFALTDNGPQGEDAVTAWETTMHNIYYLGGGPWHHPLDDSKFRSETYWGRILGTQNQVLIATGHVGTKTPDKVRCLDPLITNDRRNALSPLAPFLLNPPEIINACLERAPHGRDMPRPFACDLRLFHIPSTNEAVSIAIIECLDRAICWDEEQISPAGFLSYNRGRLYAPEGLARSFKMSENPDRLANKETYVHISRWDNRELYESCKDPTENNNTSDKRRTSSEWYQACFGSKFLRAEEQGALQEEIRVDFKPWLETPPEDRPRAEYAAMYPGSVPTHPEHGVDCEQCRPWVE